MNFLQEHDTENSEKSNESVKNRENWREMAEIGVQNAAMALQSELINGKFQYFISGKCANFLQEHDTKNSEKSNATVKNRENRS